MLKNKAINRIFFTTIIFFIVFSIHSLKHITNNISSKKEDKKEIIYTINNDNYISKTSVYVGKVFTLQDRIKEKLEIMTKENDKNSLLPSYFNPILPSNTKVLEVKVEDSIVKINFSKELENITEEQSEKMIEAIIYTITEDNILGIEIYVEGKMLKYVPHTKKELPTILNRDYGINKVYNIKNYQNIAKVILNYYVDNNGEYLEIPVTMYLNDEREKLEIILDELSKKTNSNKLINLLEEKGTFSVINKDEIIINFRNDINDKESNLIIKSVFDNYDVDKVKILVSNIKKYEKSKKDIEK